MTAEAILHSLSGFGAKGMPRTQLGKPGTLSQTGEFNFTRGWRAGDPINNLTQEGRVPTWATVKERIWKNEAIYNAKNYSQANVDLMRQGNAPQFLIKKRGKWKAWNYTIRQCRKEKEAFLMSKRLRLKLQRWVESHW
jgi:hypothetical protein